jgi:hypothetical protein
MTCIRRRRLHRSTSRRSVSPAIAVCPVTPSRAATTPPPPAAMDLLHLRRALGASAPCATRCRPRAVSPFDFSSVSHSGSRRASGHCVSRRDYSSFGLHRLYYAYAVHQDASSRHSTSCQLVALALTVCPVIPLCVVTTRLAAAMDILRLRHAFGCLGTSRGSSLTSLPRAGSYAARPGASAHGAARHRLLRRRHALGCLDTSCGSSHDLSRCLSSTTSLTARVRIPRHVAWLVVDYFTSRRLVVDYFAYATRPGASARRVARLVARRRLLRLCCAFGCLGTSRDSSSITSPRAGSSSTTSPTPRVRCLDALRSTSRGSSSTTSPHVGSSSTTSPTPRVPCRGSPRGSSLGSSSTTSTMPRVQVSRHVVQLVMRLIIDYFAYAARPGASARRMAYRRLLRLQRVSECLGTSHDSSCGSSSTTSPRTGSSHRSSSTTSPTPRVRVHQHVARLVVDYFASRRLVVDYFAYTVHPGALARRAAHRQLLRLCRASECLGTSRDSSSITSPRAGSLSTTSPTPHVQVPRHVARLVWRLVVDYFASRRLVVGYFAYGERPGATARHAARCRLLRVRRVSGCLGTSCGPSRGSLSTTPCVVTSFGSHTSSTSATPCVATTCLAASLALLPVRRVSPRCRLLVALCRPFISTSFSN